MGRSSSKPFLSIQQKQHVYHQQYDDTNNMMKILKQISIAFATGNQQNINISVRQLENQVDNPNSQLTQIQWLYKDSKEIFKNVTKIRQRFMSFLNIFSQKTNQIQESFTFLLKEQDLKSINSTQRLFSLISERIENPQLMSYSDHQQKQLTPINYQSQKTSYTKIHNKNIKLQSVLTIFWVGKSIFNLINWKLLSSDQKKNKIAPQPQNWGNFIDDKFYQIMSIFYDWMITIPSFNIIIEAFNNKKSVDVIKLQEDSDECSSDIFINISAANFKMQLVDIVKNWSQAYKAWNTLMKQFMKKDGQFEVMNERKDDFTKIVDKISECFNWKASDSLVNKKKNKMQEKVQDHSEINIWNSKQIEDLKEVLKSKEQQNEKLKIQVKDKNQIIRKLQGQIEGLLSASASSSQNSVNQIAEQKKKKQEAQKKVIELQAKVVKLEKQAQNKKIIEKNLNDYLHKTKQQFYDSIISINREVRSTILSQKKVFEKFKEKYPANEKEFSQTIRKLVNDIKIQLQNAKSSFKESTDKYQENITELTQKITDLSQINESLNKQNSTFKQQNAEKIEQIHKSYKQTVDKLTQDLKKMTGKEQQQINMLKQIQNKYQNEIRLLETKIQQNKNDLQKKQQEIKSLAQSKEQEENNLNNKIKLLQEDLQKSVQNLKKTNEEKDQYQRKNDQNYSQLQYHKNRKPQRCFSQYFNGHILNIDTEEDIKWVVESIEKYMCKQIRSTKMLCRMDHQNKNNLHNYIDFVPNIVFVGRMENGQTIIAYSEPEFKRPLGKIDYRPGMILALRNRRIFTVKRQKTNKLNKTDPKPIDWDEYYVIWGNADLRIRMNDTEFYSNYSTTNCAYEERGNPNKASIVDMFEGDDRVTKLLNYEFYQIKFEGQMETQTGAKYD